MTYQQSFILQPRFIRLGSQKKAVEQTQRELERVMVLAPGATFLGVEDHELLVLLLKVVNRL